MNHCHIFSSFNGEKMARPSFRGFLKSVTGWVGGLLDVQKIVNLFGVGAGSAIEDTGVVINHETALTIAALYRARNVLAGAFAATEFRLAESTKKGLVPLDGNPIDDALRFGLDADMDPAVFWDAIISHAAFKGNGYASLVFDEDTGDFVNATLMEPDWVKADNAPDGSPGYWYAEPGKQKQWLDEYEVLHFTGPTYDGRQGISWIDLARRSLGLAINTERYGARFFSKGYIFSGILNVPGAIKKDQEEQLRADLKRMHEGPANSHGVLFLKGEQKYTPNTAINPQDAQFLATRSFNVYEISRWTGVPPSKLYVESGVSYNGAEQEELDFRTNCLLPWVIRAKQQIARKLVPFEMRRKWVVTHSFQNLLAMDRLSAIRAEALAINWGMSTPNRSIKRLDLGTDIEGGDMPMRPGNMQPIGSQPGSMPGTGGPVANSPAATDQQPSNETDQVTAVDLSLNGAQVTALQGIVSDVAAGLITKETGKALVQAAFPQLTQEQIDSIFAGIVEGSQPAPEDQGTQL